MKKALAIVALVAATGLTLTACGEGDSDETTGATGSSESSTDFNEADVRFAQEMIPHHQQAVEMAEMAEGRASSDEVQQLAEGIQAAQDPEIEMMTGWLEAWGEEAPSDDMGHGDMGHGSDEPMAGMMSAEQMGELEAASGEDWDRMFLEMMVEHHEGAIEMAQVEVAEGQNDEAVALAEKIIEDQQAEIETMEQMLSS